MQTISSHPVSTAYCTTLTKEMSIRLCLSKWPLKCDKMQIPFLLHIIHSLLNAHRLFAKCWPKICPVNHVAPHSRCTICWNANYLSFSSCELLMDYLNNWRKFAGVITKLSSFNYLGVEFAKKGNKFPHSQHRHYHIRYQNKILWKSYIYIYWR